MKATDVFKRALGRNNAVIAMAVKDLAEDDFHHQPNANDNTIAWMIWHQTRYEDNSIAVMSGRDQAWIGDKWHEKFGMPPDPGNNGVGHQIDQVRAFRADKDHLLAYMAAVRARTNSYLETLGESDLERKITNTFGEEITIGEWLTRLLGDHTQHTGQICYLRGHMKGHGWFPR
ncbi:MAG: DinB family protein [bacterium]|nr:DinB family protein [bacterium]